MNDRAEEFEAVSLKDRIFQAALEEFAEKGYEAASTNSIMIKAGVSKGLIFHYFHSKKELYLECVRYTVDCFTKICLDAVDFSEIDFFERTKKYVMAKLDLFSKRQQEYRLILDGHAMMREGLVPELKEYFDALQNNFWLEFYKGLDFSRIKKIAPPKKILDYTVMIFEAFSVKYLETHKLDADNIDDLYKCVQEVEVIYEMLKYGIYEEPTVTGTQNMEVGNVNI